MSGRTQNTLNINRDEFVIFDNVLEPMSHVLEQFFDVGGTFFWDELLKMFYPHVNALFILPQNNVECSRVQQCQQEKNHVSLNVSSEFLHLFPSTENEQLPVPCRKGQFLFSSGKVVGFYCSTKNLLCLYGWDTSEKWTRYFLSDLFPYLVKALGVRKVSFAESPAVSKVNVGLGCTVELEQLSSWKEYSVIKTVYKGNGPIGDDLEKEGVLVLRVGETNKVSTIIDNLKKLFREIFDPVSVKGDVYPLELHLRIVLPEEVLWSAPFLCLALHEFLYLFSVPVWGKASEQAKETILTPCVKTSGTKLEYSLPSGLAFHPDILLVTFKLCKALVEYVIKQKKMVLFTSIDDLYKIGKLSFEEIRLLVDFVLWYSEHYTGTPINDNWVKNIPLKPLLKRS